VQWNPVTSGFRCAIGIPLRGRSPGTAKGRTATPYAPSEVGCYLAAALSFEPADTLTE